MMDDWSESEAKAECLDLRLKVRELELEAERLKSEFDALLAENKRLRAANNKALNTRIAQDFVSLGFRK